MSCAARISGGDPDSPTPQPGAQRKPASGASPHSTRDQSHQNKVLFLSGSVIIDGDINLCILLVILWLKSKFEARSFGLLRSYPLYMMLPRDCRELQEEKVIETRHTFCMVTTLPIAYGMQSCWPTFYCPNIQLSRSKQFPTFSIRELCEEIADNGLWFPERWSLQNLTEKIQ